MASPVSSSRRGVLEYAGAAIALVLFRSLVATTFEGFYLDSDQAIVGLMARHVATLHDFPLYYYGLNYLLGVQAWIIAPFFWLFRSSVAVMRLPLILLNAAVVVSLMAMFRARLRLSPALAFVAALPLIMPTPAVGNHLIEAAGASIEPFAYVLLLWWLRRRSFAFGCLLAFGTLHREFTIFALPAIVLVEAASGELWSRATIPRTAWAAAGFALVWLIVDDLKMHLAGAPLALQVASLGQQMCFDADWPSRAHALVARALPALYGGRPMLLNQWRMDTPLAAGYAFVGWTVAFALLVMFVRLVARRASPRPGTDERFGSYLAWIGLLTACVYPLSCNVVFRYPPIVRYLLFAMLLPVGLTATFLSRERSPLLRTIVVTIIVAWSAVNFVDNARVLVTAVRQPPLNERRVLTDYLTSHGIRYATATYWDAYVVDFLSQERVIVASSDTVRIPEYQSVIDAHAVDAVHLGRQPCPGYDAVASWCIQRR